MLRPNRLRAATTDRVLEEQARRARKLQGDKLGLEDFAQFLDLPVTDTLKEVHSFFDEVNIKEVQDTANGNV